ncbi:MAG TPA: cytochrome P450 [Conexibacter sp.]|nr:cytochrome P450 [Conexibacter sp.]
MGPTYSRHGRARRPDAVPGPRFQRAAGLRFFDAGWFAMLEASQRRYGDVFRLRLPVFGEAVVIGEPAAFRAVLLDNDATLTQVARGRPARGLVATQPMALRDGPSHIARRRMISPHFHGRRLAEHEATVASVVEAHAARLRAGQQLRIADVSLPLMMDVTARTLFGFEGATERARFALLFRRLLSAWATALLVPRALARDGMPGPWRRFVRARADLRALVLAQIERLRHAQDPGSSVCSMLLAATDADGASLSERELEDELLTLAIAGTHTTSAALMWLFDYALHDEDARRRLEADPGDQPFADALIEETLRIQTVIDAGPRTLARDMELAGVDVPAGTVIYPTVHLIHRRPDLYDAPAEFVPERFLGGRPSALAWVPFGGGAHRCIGASLAQLQLRVALRELMTRWRFTPLRSSVSRPRRSALFWVPAGGVPVQIERNATGRRT